MSRIHTTTEHDNEAKRADMVGASVIVLEGKAREYALKEFFGKKIDTIVTEVVIQQRGAPPEGLDLLPKASLK